MPNIKQAIKKARQDLKKNKVNTINLTKMRTVLKKTIDTIESGDKEKANSSIGLLQSALDKAVSKGVIHSNKANRHKSRIIKKIKALK